MIPEHRAIIESSKMFGGGNTINRDTYNYAQPAQGPKISQIINAKQLNKSNSRIVVFKRRSAMNHEVSPSNAEQTVSD